MNRKNRTSIKRKGEYYKERGILPSGDWILEKSIVQVMNEFYTESSGDLVRPTLTLELDLLFSILSRFIPMGSGTRDRLGWFSPLGGYRF